MSIFDSLNLPDTLVHLLLLLSLLGCAAALLPQLDFGVVKIPRLDLHHKVLFRRASPLILVVTLIGNFEFWGETETISEDRRSPYSLGFLGQPNGFEVELKNGTSIQFSEEEIVPVAQGIFGSKQVDLTNSLSEEGRRRKAAIAIAELAFENRDYETAARLYSLSMAYFEKHDAHYYQVSGMVTAGLYGSGQHGVAP